MKNSRLPDVVVIGNSPTALLNELGEKIDTFEKVIRVNKCQTLGYEKFIGKKTSIWSTTDNERWDFYIPDTIEDQRIWLRSPRTLNKMNNSDQFQKICKSLCIDSLSIEVLFKLEKSDNKIKEFFNGSGSQYWKAPTLDMSLVLGFLQYLRQLVNLKELLF